MNKASLIILIILALLGVVDSLVLLNIHYEGSSNSCPVVGEAMCDRVNQSIYADVFGFPTAAIGVIGYLLLAVTGLGVLRGYRWAKNWLLLAMSMIGFFFALYLTFIEFFVLHAYCTWCIGSQVIVFIIMILAILVAFSK
ncbi:vitamin K epoxide reductase family protein [Nanoarchaeota archaeon]